MICQHPALCFPSLIRKKHRSSAPHLPPRFMSQTPVHEFHNPELLDIIPWGASKLIEVGCSSGAMAREFKKISPTCHYLGIEIDPAYAKLAQRYCDQSLVLDIETADDTFWSTNADRDCWIFGDTLEHLRDPWKVLRQVRSVLGVFRNSEKNCINIGRITSYEIVKGFRITVSKPFDEICFGPSKYVRVISRGCDFRKTFLVKCYGFAEDHLVRIRPRNE